MIYVRLGKLEVRLGMVELFIIAFLIYLALRGFMPVVGLLIITWIFVEHL